MTKTTEDPTAVEGIRALIHLVVSFAEFFKHLFERLKNIQAKDIITRLYHECFIISQVTICVYCIV